MKRFAEFTFITSNAPQGAGAPGITKTTGTKTKPTL
mgnify:CR=1 FL=1